MEKSLVRLTQLVTDEPQHRPTSLAEVRALLAHIATLDKGKSRTAIAKLTVAIGSDFEVWFGPRHWDGGPVAIAAAKAGLLADLMKLHGALLRVRH